MGTLKRIYDYDPVTGHVGSTNTSDFKNDDPVFQKENILVKDLDLDGHERVRVIDPYDDDQEKVIDLMPGVTLELANGKPVRDKDGILTGTLPPPPPPGVLDHVFMAMVKKGDIDIEEVDDNVLKSLNVSLKFHGKAQVQKARK